MLKITEAVRLFGPIFFPVKTNVLSLEKNGLGYIFGGFSQLIWGRFFVHFFQGKFFTKNVGKNCNFPRKKF
jgi:hypothetical protein